VLGRHDGTINFTVGQRRGLGVASPEPLYVVRLEPATRRVVVGPREALMADRLELRGVNWIGAEPPPAGTPVIARLRSTHPGAAAILVEADDREAAVVLVEPEPATAPGQACVLYDGSCLIGGGWIARMAAAVGPSGPRPAAAARAEAPASAQGGEAYPA